MRVKRDKEQLLQLLSRLPSKRKALADTRNLSATTRFFILSYCDIISNYCQKSVTKNGNLSSYMLAVAFRVAVAKVVAND